MSGHYWFLFDLYVLHIKIYIFSWYSVLSCKFITWCPRYENAFYATCQKLKRGIRHLSLHFDISGELVTVNLITIVGHYTSLHVSVVCTMFVIFVPCLAHIYHLIISNCLFAWYNYKDSLTTIYFYKFSICIRCDKTQAFIFLNYPLWFSLSFQLLSHLY